MRSEVAPGATGEGISKGFGFVEFKHHSHALTALQQTNNVSGILSSLCIFDIINLFPGLFPALKNRGLIVDFAVENSQKLQKMKERQEHAREQAKRKREDNGDEANVRFLLSFLLF